MSPFPVVEHFGRVEYVGTSVHPRCVDFALNAFAFERLEETLRHCIVVAISAAAQTDIEFVITDTRTGYALSRLNALRSLRHCNLDRRPVELPLLNPSGYHLLLIFTSPASIFMAERCLANSWRFNRLSHNSVLEPA